MSKALKGWAKADAAQALLREAGIRDARVSRRPGGFVAYGTYGGRRESAEHATSATLAARALLKKFGIEAGP